MKTPEQIAEEVFVHHGYAPGGYRDLPAMDVHKAWMVRAIRADREAKEDAVANATTPDELCGARAVRGGVVWGTCSRRTMHDAQHNSGQADVPSDQHHSTEPQFASECDPDQYRSAWRAIEPADDYRADTFRITVESRVDLDGCSVRRTLEVTQSQMHAALAYLSEQYR